MNNPQPWWLTWPVAEVAAAILPFFAHSPHVFDHRTILGIVSWCKTGTFRTPGWIKDHSDSWFTDPDMRAIAEAIQVLERTGLLLRGPAYRDASEDYLGLTRLGMQVLQTNTVRQHLGLSDAPPTA